MIMPEINIKNTRPSSADRSLSVIVLLTMLMLFSVEVQAQPGGLEDDPGTSVPVDGGFATLLGAGILYGVRRLKSRHRGEGRKVKDRPVT
jgi:hypothetical protein